MSETREYVSKPETVRATLWNKSGDHKAVIYTPDGEYVLYCDFNAVVRPGYWIVEHADGRIEALSGDLFYTLYSTPAPAAPPPGSAEGDALHRAQVEDARSLILHVISDMPDEWRVDIVPHTSQPSLSIAVHTLRALLFAAENAEYYRQACIRQSHEIEQVLGKALGYPRYADDPKAFPGATEADGVCVGDHAAESLADEAADKIRDLRSRLAAAEARPRIATLRSQVMALADLKDGWHDGEGTAYEPTQLAAVAGLLELLAGIAAGQVYPVPSKLSEPSGLVRCDVDTDEVILDEIMPESLAEARPLKSWAVGFAFGLRDGCPGPERFWEHAPDFQHGFDAARSIKDDLPAEARPRVGEAWIPAVERLPELAARSGWCADVLVFNGHVVRAAVYCYESATAERLNGRRDFRLPNSMTIIAGVTHRMPFPPPPHSEAADATPV